MQYAIFPMLNVNISKRYSSSHYAWDICGEDTSAEYWRAPCRIKVLKILPPNEGSNTVLFGTCDSQGNQMAVMCADGQMRVLTFACTHINSLNVFGLAEGKIYESGEVCYQEGTYGEATGNHVHMEVGEGWIYEKAWTDEQWVLKNPSNVIEKTFYLLNGWNVVLDTSGYNFPTVNVRETSTPVVPSSNIQMKLTGSAAYLRSDVVTGDQIILVPNGSYIEVIGLYSWNASDNYKWGYGKWNGYEGYFQYDPYVMNPVGSPDFETYKMYLFGSQARIRESIGGTELTMVNQYNNIFIDEFIDGKQFDGYQWCRGHFGSTYGYFQYDPVVMYPTND